MKKKVTLSLENTIYENFQKYCEDKGLMLSRQIELFMKKELEHKRR